MTRPAPRFRRRPFIAMLASAAVPLLPLNSALAAPGEQAFAPYWVQNHTPTELWSGPDNRATSFGSVKAFSYFKVLQPQAGPRLYVQNPLNEGTAWISAATVGPSGEPPAAYFAPPPPPEPAVAVRTPSRPGRIIGGANIRRRPAVVPETWLSRAGHNQAVEVLDEVTGEDGETWYRIADQQYVHHSLVRLPKPFPPHPGRLIVAELSEPVIVTAYQDAIPVYSALALKGTRAWATPTGFFTIRRRVANETMDSATLGIPRNAPGGYFLKDVLYTQYFTADGASIHYNYWSGNFGYSGSHGCLGMNLEDSRWFWEWAGNGTPLVIQE